MHPPVSLGQIFPEPLPEVFGFSEVHLLEPNVTPSKGQRKGWKLNIWLITSDNTSIYLQKIKSTATGTAIVTHEPLGAVVLLWSDCGSLNRIIYSQYGRQPVRNEPNMGRNVWDVSVFSSNEESTAGCEEDLNNLIWFLPEWEPWIILVETRWKLRWVK